MIYLAGPYSHDNPDVMVERFEALTLEAARYLHKGVVVYSPITHNHPIAVRHGLPRGWGFWKVFDTEFIKMCDELHVLQLPGWDKSEGVRMEISLAVALNKPVHFILP